MKITVLISFIILSTLSFAQDNSNRVHSAIRLIGNQIQKQNHDNSSVLPPVIQDSNSYLLQFPTELQIEPETLIFTADSLFQLIPNIQSVDIQIFQCSSDSILYSSSFEFKSEQHLLPCKGRKFPKDCYQVLFTIQEFFPPIQIEQKNSTSSFQNWLIVLLLLIVLALLFFLIRRKQQVYSTLSFENSVLDQQKQEIRINGNSISLSFKEFRLIQILFQQPNTVLTKEFLLETVWGNEADYIGRTLDVFISKIRKKLEPDHSLEIINIRGIGYQLKRK